MTWLMERIKELISRRFYGKLTISFQSGKITHCELRETLKPE